MLLLTTCWITHLGIGASMDFSGLTLLQFVPKNSTDNSTIIESETLPYKNNKTSLRYKRSIFNSKKDFHYYSTSEENYSYEENDFVNEEVSKIIYFNGTVKQILKRLPESDNDTYCYLEVNIYYTNNYKHRNNDDDDDDDDDGVYKHITKICRTREVTSDLVFTRTEAAFYGKIPYN